LSKLNTPYVGAHDSMGSMMAHIPAEKKEEAIKGRNIQNGEDQNCKVGS